METKDLEITSDAADMPLLYSAAPAKCFPEHNRDAPSATNNAKFSQILVTIKDSASPVSNESVCRFGDRTWRNREHEAGYGSKAQALC